MKLNIQSNYYLHIQYNFSNSFNKVFVQIPFVQIYKYFELLIIDHVKISYILLARLK